MRRERGAPNLETESGTVSECDIALCRHKSLVNVENDVFFQKSRLIGVSTVLLIRVFVKRCRQFRVSLWL